MAALNQNFDPNQQEDMMDFSPIPAGEYVAHITESEMKPTKNNQGKYLQLTFNVDTPGFTGRKVWSRLNLVNQNATAVEIANRELGSICKAVGVGVISDSDVLHGKPLIIKVKIDPATAQYGESNSIIAYKSAGSMATPSPSPMQTPENPAESQVDNSKPAWA